VIIGADHKILGFDDALVPGEGAVNAALEGRITTTRPGPETIKAFVDSGAVLLEAQPRVMPRVKTFKPDFAPSDMLHVSPAKGEQRGSFGGDDFISLQGFGLREAIQAVYKDTPIRVSLPAALDNDKRYDFALVLPEAEGQEKMNEDFRKGLEEYFHVTARRESRLVDVYVVTALPNRKPPAVDPSPDQFGGHAESASYEFEAEGGADGMKGGMKPQPVGAMRSVAIDGTVDRFCELLEEALDRPVVNETQLEGEFKFHVKSSEKQANDFLDRLRDETGLVISPGQRNVEMLVLDGR
jgi:uncharacterized protein (TIGR03435 family)